MKTATTPIIIIIISYCTYIFGKNIQNITAPLILTAHGAEPIWTGIVASMFYIGLILGSLMTENMAVRIGPNRSFIWLAILTAITALLQALTISAGLWSLLMLVSGYTCAGIVILTESYLLRASPHTYRGRILSIYILSACFSRAIGQTILYIPSPDGSLYFVIGTTCMLIAMLPIALRQIQLYPQPHQTGVTLKSLWDISPLAVISCFIGGFFQGTIGLSLPAYLYDLGLPQVDIANTMFMTVLGGALLPYPMGHLADSQKKSRLIGLIGISLVLTTLAFNHYAAIHQTIGQLGYGFLLGGLGICIYPIGINMATSKLSDDRHMASVQSLLLSYSIGATMGPISLALLQYVHNQYALAWSFGSAASLLTLSAILRKKVYNPDKAELRHI
jgi:MFS family permease